MRSLSFDSAQYHHAVAEYKRDWLLADRTLYNLCQFNWQHSDRAAVHAKLLIVGRSYATGLERRVLSKGTQGSSLGQVIEHLLARASEIDELVQRLRDLSEPLTADALRVILNVHGEFCSIVGEVTRQNQSPRSFASKYLHFHAPIVPIYDSIAAGVLPKFVRWHRELEVFGKDDAFDDGYCRFCLRFLRLFDKAKAHAGILATVRHLDYYLIYTAYRLSALSGTPR